MLVGWDFLGLTSLILIIHYQRPYVFNYGIITFLINRFGDICFIIAGALIFNLGSWRLSFEHTNITLIFLIIAGFTKRAQLPFSSWLPKAIAAPTPVSALVHSSTLVTAGVILLIRINPFIQNKTLRIYLLFISVLSIFLGSIAAIINYDLKKIIAFSTLRQISFIITILLIGRPNLAFFHLLTHALFKSLIFISAGTIIHHSIGEQDIRKINNLRNWLPLEITIINISIIALIGFPFYSGFFSKDVIIEFAIISELNLIIIIILDLSICLTAFYSCRLIYYICWNSHSKLINFNYLTSIQEKNVIIFFSIPIIISGRIISWLFLKKFYIENPLPLFIKSFGVWGSLIILLITFLIIKINYTFKKKKITLIINSISYTDLVFKYIIIKTNKISTFHLNLIENIWNKFINIIIIYNNKKILFNTQKFQVISINKIIFIYLIIIFITIIINLYLNSLK